MIWKRAIFLILVLLTTAIAKAITIDEARKLYTESINDKSACSTSYSRFKEIQSTDNTLLVGYKGAIAVAMSKHGKTAKEKLAYFNEGKLLLEQAIARDAENVELRFLRFTIQQNCPPALKYNKQIAADKQFILDNLASVKNSSVRKRIKDYMLQSCNCSTAEKQKLNDI